MEKRSDHLEKMVECIKESRNFKSEIELYKALTDELSLLNLPTDIMHCILGMAISFYQLKPPPDTDMSNLAQVLASHVKVCVNRLPKESKRLWFSGGPLHEA